MSSNLAHGKVYSIQPYVIKVCQWLVTGHWFSPGTPFSSTNKIDLHNIVESGVKHHNPNPLHLLVCVLSVNALKQSPNLRIHSLKKKKIVIFRNKICFCRLHIPYYIPTYNVIINKNKSLYNNWFLFNVFITMYDL